MGAVEEAIEAGNNSSNRISRESSTLRGKQDARPTTSAPTNSPTTTTTTIETTTTTATTNHPRTIQGVVSTEVEATRVGEEAEEEETTEGEEGEEEGTKCSSQLYQFYGQHCNN